MKESVKDEAIRNLIARLVKQERERQLKLKIERDWKDNSFHEFNTVLTEEVGELAKEILEHSREKSDWNKFKRLKNIRTEAIQVAAVACAIAEQAEREIDLFADKFNEGLTNERTV